MSRVHDALRRAEQLTYPAPAARIETPAGAPAPPAATLLPSSLVEGLLEKIQDVPFTPSSDGHLIDGSRPREAPAEEFRTLRTRLNHLQTLQPIHTIVVTSPSPAEGKSFAAVNLALTEAQLESNRVLLIDCDFRRPVVHSLLQLITIYNWLRVATTIMTVLAAWQLRRKRPDMPRPFRIPGGQLGLIGTVGAIIVMSAVALLGSDRYGLRWGPVALASGPVIYLVLRRLGMMKAT